MLTDKKQRGNIKSMENELGVLSVGGFDYYLSTVLAMIKGCPTIDVFDKDINYSGVTISPKSIDVKDEQLLVFKQNGKYTVLAGLNQIVKTKSSPKFNGTYSVKLISTPTLKKARIVTDAEELVETKYPSTFANTPRIISSSRRNDGTTSY